MGKKGFLVQRKHQLNDDIIRKILSDNLVSYFGPLSFAIFQSFVCFLDWLMACICWFALWYNSTVCIKGYLIWHIKYLFALVNYFIYSRKDWSFLCPRSEREWINRHVCCCVVQTILCSLRWSSFSFLIYLNSSKTHCYSAYHISHLFFPCGHVFPSLSYNHIQLIRCSSWYVHMFFGYLAC